ncbi:N-acetyltransferase [Phyllobacterium sp. 0TCS1.6C]|uniref:GNAT family N-acetyltransferase n=1 Tax=unclassified Phyllobacterium TaxID=2638441 RepID=UPI0022640CBF|nr:MULTISPECIES: N-acetyltransferase [unclassified Phyllobacterium]MCX8280897.1 N-acetyltransferase [Phyllobacterium sp. 0TCS1.6C]MCX8295763.1 N-acetyltransferase [Phyllobacterium sp. 0TCS1.6A]
MNAAEKIGRVQPGAKAFTIVNELPQDEAAREELLDRAMGPARRRKSSEKLRRGRLPSEGMAFVARDADGRLLGTVRLWDIQAGHDALGLPIRALLLGPLAVDPSIKGSGIGAGLMRHAIAEAARLGHGAILLVGDPEYYERFGFSGANTTSLAMPGPVERHRFLALELRAGHLAGAHGVLMPRGRKAKMSVTAPVSLRFSAR